MPIRRYHGHEVWCDICDSTLDLGGVERAKAERDAKTFGWHKSGARWTCPECSAKTPARNGKGCADHAGATP